MRENPGAFVLHYERLSAAKINHVVPPELFCEISVIREHLGQDRIRMAFSEYSHVLTVCKGLLKRLTAHGEVNSSLCPLLFAFGSGQFKANKMVLQIFVQHNMRCNCTQGQGFSSKYLQPLLHQVLKRTKNGFRPERRCRVGMLPSCLF